MASIKTAIPVSGEVTTTDTSTWAEVCRCTISSNCAIAIQNIYVLGRHNTILAIAYSKAEQRAMRFGGTLTLMGSLTTLITFNTGSSSSYNSSQMRIVVSGNDLVLQVRSGNASSTTWYGGFTATLN